MHLLHFIGKSLKKKKVHVWNEYLYSTICIRTIPLYTLQPLKRIITTWTQNLPHHDDYVAYLINESVLLNLSFPSELFWFNEYFIHCSTTPWNWNKQWPEFFSAKIKASLTLISSNSRWQQFNMFCKQVCRFLCGWVFSTNNRGTRLHAPPRNAGKWLFRKIVLRD